MNAQFRAWYLHWSSGQYSTNRSKVVVFMARGRREMKRGGAVISERLPDWPDAPLNTKTKETRQTSTCDNSTTMDPINEAIAATNLVIGGKQLLHTKAA
jgi:hypothetical protein